jgi:hypothetical protein
MKKAMGNEVISSVIIFSNSLEPDLLGVIAENPREVPRLVRSNPLPVVAALRLLIPGMTL